MWKLQGKHVPGNDIYSANIVQKRKYRQVAYETESFTHLELGQLAQDPSICT